MVDDEGKESLIYSNERKRDPPWIFDKCQDPSSNDNSSEGGMSF